MSYNLLFWSGHGPGVLSLFQRVSNIYNYHIGIDWDGIVIGKVYVKWGLKYETC